MKKKRIMKWLGVCIGIILCGLSRQVIYADENEETVIEEANNSQIEEEPNITYYSHVSTIGDTEPVENGEVTGTEGKGLQMEALCIELDPGDYSGDIEYSAHVENIGWQDYVSSSSVAGTTGKGLQMEAVRIRLTDELAENYDVYYSAHIADYGWLGWAVNDQVSGSVGQGIQMEALKIMIQKKDVEAPVSNKEAFIANQLNYQAHVSNIGWMDTVNEGNTAGTTGRALGIEALRIELDNAQYEGDIEYSVYVKGEGWQNYVSGADIAGTVGKAKPLEAVKVRLTGEIANYYDVYYRVHSSNIGWQGWTCSNKGAGTLDYGHQMEAIQLQLVSKLEMAPQTSPDAFFANYLTYQTHVSNIGWMDVADEGNVAGTERGYSIEAFQLNLKQTGYSGGVEYRSHIADVGWEDAWKTNHDISGTTGQARAVQAVQIRLSGEVSNYYDIAYRTYVFGIGWMKWAENGTTSGTEGLAIPIQAMQVRLVEKNTVIADENTVTNLYGDTGYQSGNILTGWQKMGSGNYYFDSAGTMVTNKMINGKYLGTSGKVVDFYGLSSILKNYLYETAFDGEDWSVSIIFNDEQLDIYNHSMQSASVMKLFVMGTIYENYAEMIQVYGQNVIDTYLHDMITVSDNYSWKQLRRCLGYGDEEAGCQRINTWAASQGYYDTYNSSEAYQNYTSTHDSSKIIYDMYNHRFACSDLMLSLLHQQTRTWKIPAGIPEGVPTGNKTGELDNCENDAAIVYAPYGTFTLSVMSYNLQYTGYAQAMIRTIASTVYDYLAAY